MAKNQVSSVDIENVRTLLLIRGVISIIVGVVALVWPGLTLVTLGILLAVWLFASGVANMIRSIMEIGNGGLRWLMTMLLAVLQLGVGAYLVQRPGISTATLIALVSISLIVEGVVAIIAPFIENTGENKLVPVTFGILTFLAGLAIWRYPVSNSLAFVWVFGLFALASGPMMIATSMHIGKANR